MLDVLVCLARALSGEGKGGATVAGFSKLYVIGGLGGFQGADGVNPIYLQLLVGESDRQWIEPHYFDESLKPLGGLQVIVPEKLDDPDLLLDACIAFFPEHFRSCPSLAATESALCGTKALDFNDAPGAIPPTWTKLRGEARALFRELNIWQAVLVPLRGGH
jgi:hypothetical protein